MSSTSPTSARPGRPSRTATSRGGDGASPRGSKRGSKGSARRVIRQVHAYLGLALSLLLFVFGASGAALVYKEAYWGWRYPELRGPLPQLGPDDQAAAVAVAAAEFGDDLRSVKMPEPGVAGFHLYLEGGEAFLSPGDLRVLDRWGSRDRVMAWLFDLHAHLMAGERGERVGGWISLLGVVLALTGLVLWWPTRRQFAPRNLLPKGVTRRALIAWHRDLGVVSAPVLLVLLLSGSALVFYSTAGAVLNGIFGDPPLPATLPPAVTGPTAPLADAGIFARVREEFPEARLVFYYPPPEGQAYTEFRLKQPCELHPNGRSYLYLSAEGEVLAKTDACALPPGEKVLHAAYPLHSGKTESGTYKLLTFLGGLALAAISGSGGVAYARKAGWIGKA